MSKLNQSNMKFNIKLSTSKLSYFFSNIFNSSIIELIVRLKSIYNIWWIFTTFFVNKISINK